VLSRLDAIVGFAEIERFIDNPVRTYSTGMQMRLAFSAAIHADPEILLIDEVLSVGDIAFQHKCLERIATFKASGCSIVLVTHDIGVVRHLCDEAVWLSRGRLMGDGPASEIADRYVAHMEAGRPESDDDPAP
jgi:lipopolysaccharide transport system ATP-binding protein